MPKKYLQKNMARNKKPSFGNEKAEEKRDIIFQAAVKVFARKGYHEGTIADIAREAGISYGLVYNYFKNKEDIVITLFRNRWQRFIRRIEKIQGQDCSPAEKLVKVGTFLIRSYEVEPNLMKVLVLNVVPHSYFFEKNKKAIEKAFHLIQAIIEEGQTQGVFDRRFDPKIATQGFYGGILQVLVSWIQGIVPDSPSYIKKANQFFQMLVESWSQKGC